MENQRRDPREMGTAVVRAWTTDANLRPEFEKWGLKPVRQGDRGTCSVFTTNSALEFAFSRYMGKSVQLSVEYLNS